MKFFVSSYLEYYLTMLGWLLNNSIFQILTKTGLYIVPLIGLLISTWLDVQKQGDDEGNKGELLIRWLGLKFYPAVAVFLLVLYPAVPISLSNIELNVNRSKICGYSLPVSPAESGYATGFSTEISGKTAKMPLWWAFWHQVNRGAAYAATAAIPCQPDLRQVRFEVQREEINDPNLLHEVHLFTEQCYVPARRRLQDSQVKLTPYQARETSWLGGKILIKNKELYPKYRARQPHRLFEYDPERDTGLPSNKGGGFPRCDQWWNDSSVGLKERLLADMRQNLSVQVKEFFSKKENQDEVLLRTLLRPENIDVSGGREYPGYGGNADFSLSNAFTRLLATVGTVTGAAAAYPAFDATRQALPMIQALVIMVLIILMPYIIIISAYSLRTVMTLTTVNFAVVTLTFWWELARWLDSTLLGTLYNSTAHNNSGREWVNPHFIQNTMDDIILSYVLGAMFIGVAILWLGSLAYAGYNVGTAITGALESGPSKVSDAASKGIDKIK